MKHGECNIMIRDQDGEILLATILCLSSCQGVSYEDCERERRFPVGN
jgi:hypothetical protein